MRKKTLSILLALTFVISMILPLQQVSASDLNQNYEVTSSSAIGIYDIYKYYSSDRGDSVSYSYQETQSNGDVYYYRGTLYYYGRENIFWGDYIYHGDKRDFELYKIVKSDGTVITPN